MREGPKISFLTLALVVSLVVVGPLPFQASHTSSGHGQGHSKVSKTSTTTTTTTVTTTTSSSTASTTASTTSTSSTASTSTAAPSGGMTFAVLDQSASYGIPRNKTLAVQQADLSMLLSTGAPCVRADIGYAPWLTNDTTQISLVDSVVSSIREAGECLIIADAASETYYGSGALPWAEFEQAWVQRVHTLAARYHPDYYVVVKEPGWYVPMVNDSYTNPLFQNATEWTALTRNLTLAVHSASPDTKVGVSIAAYSLITNRALYASYLAGVQAIPGVSFVGFDIYSSKDQNAAQAYLSYSPPSKDVWVAETWSSNGPQVYNSTNSQNDVDWIRSIDQFGQSIGAKMLMPFYTDLFCGYTTPTDTQSWLTFYQGRTPVYDEFTNAVAGQP